VVEASDEDVLGSNLRQRPNLFSMPPAIQAGLMNAAAALLTPHWGGGAASAGQALGAFGEAAGATGQQQWQRQQAAQHQAFQEKQLKQAETLAKLHRDTQVQTAQIHADALRDVAKTRGEYGLAHMSDPEYQTAYKAVYDAARQDVSVYGMKPEEQQAFWTQTEANARAAGEKAIASRRGAVGSATGGAPGSPGAGPPGPAGAAAVNPKSTTGATTTPAGKPIGKIDWKKYSSDKDYQAYIDKNMSWLERSRDWYSQNPSQMPKNPEFINNILRFLRPPNPAGSDTGPGSPTTAVPDYTGGF